MWLVFFTKSGLSVASKWAVLEYRCEVNTGYGDLGYYNNSLTELGLEGCSDGLSACTLLSDCTLSLS